MSQPACSVVVCTRHRAHVLPRCLESVATQDHPSYEVIVVDNTEGESRTRQIAGEAGARYLLEPEVSLSRARNTGARAARGAIAAYIDDDAVAAPDWLSRHAAALEDRTLMATSGRILTFPADTPAARTYADVQDLGPEAFRMDRNTAGWFEKANFGGAGQGPNMAFKRALFETGWGFRDSLRYLGDEAYAFFTLIRDGHAMAYVPDAVVHHAGPATMAELRLRSNLILRSSAAYMVMLLVEEPDFRRATLRYAWEGLRGERRSWRPEGQHAFAPRRQVLAAACLGPFLYLRSRLTRGSGNRAPPRPTRL